jgi:hypothetical protein
MVKNHDATFPELTMQSTLLKHYLNAFLKRKVPLTLKEHHAAKNNGL